MRRPVCLCFSLAILVTGLPARVRAAVPGGDMPVAAPPATDLDAADAGRTRRIWEYALLGTAIAGVATGVTLVTVNHARVQDYNLGVKTYNEGVNQNAATLQALADLRDSINTGERWGYIVGAIGVAAGFGAAFLYVTESDGGHAATDASAGLSVGPGSLSVWGRF